MDEWGGSFTATGVPNNDLGTGTVRFAITMWDAQSNTATTSVDLEKPDLLYVESYTNRMTKHDLTKETYYTGEDFGTIWGWQSDSNGYGAGLMWNNGAPGSGTNWHESWGGGNKPASNSLCDL